METTPTDCGLEHTPEARRLRERELRSQPHLHSLKVATLGAAIATRRSNIVTTESLTALADQVGAMCAALEDEDAPDRPHVSKAGRAHLQGAEDALRAVASGRT